VTGFNFLSLTTDIVLQNKFGCWITRHISGEWR